MADGSVTSRYGVVGRRGRGFSEARGVLATPHMWFRAEAVPRKTIAQGLVVLEVRVAPLPLCLIAWPRGRKGSRVMR